MRKYDQSFDPQLSPATQLWVCRLEIPPQGLNFTLGLRSRS
jgi:hypothetical protein